MALKKEDIIELYQSYSFELGASNDDYVVFFNQKGYFQNAEIVLLSEEYDKDKVDKVGYEELGYAVRIRSFNTLEEAHEALFSGFFNASITNKRLESEYEEFCVRQKNALMGIEYEYIPGNYIEEGVSVEGNVVNRIKDIFGSEQRHLIILEASAGYGKTCTSYEVINKLINEYPKRIPLMAELSKNRSAPVFRYVLLSEIDQKFPALSSALVTKEIMNGRILLIIDGFDELLSKTDTVSAEGGNFGEDAQTMLDTIAELLPFGTNTKILLTTRNSSMMVGEDFDNWMENHIKDCAVTRLQLEEPNARDWLGAEKLDVLKDKGIIINNILNPVLLASLRANNIEEISEYYDDNNDVVEHYLELLLSRERIRQSLLLTVQEQRNIMSGLSSMMVEYDFSAEEIDFINACLIEIIGDRLDEYISRYKDVQEFNTEEKIPNADEIVNKLSHHALLDRKIDNKNLVGFVNQYIFGLMIAEAVMMGKLMVDSLKGKYLDIAISSYSSYGKNSRYDFYNKISSVINSSSNQNRLKYEIDLLGTTKTVYNNAYFERLVFKSKTELTQQGTFIDCIFTDCTFRKCKIRPSAFLGCQFLNCTFYNVDIIDEASECGLMFFSCRGHEVFEEKAKTQLEIVDNSINYEKVVLEQFWRPGAEWADSHRGYQTLFRGVSNEERQFISDAVEALLRRRILIKGKKAISLNRDMLEEIMTILER